MNKIQLKIPQLKITLSSQQKIIIVALIIIAAFWVFCLLVFSPQRNSISSIKSQTLRLEGQAQRIEQIIASARTIEGSIDILKKRSRDLNERFLQANEEASLKTLSDFAESFGMKLISNNVQPKRDFLDEENKKIELKGKVCRVIPVSLMMEGNYINFAKYLEALDENLPVFWIIKSVKIVRTSPGSLLLNISLEVNLYLFS